MNDVLKGDVSVEMRKPKSSSRATVDVEGSWIKASSCVAVSQFLVGGDMESSVGAGKISNLNAYSVGISKGGMKWGASLKCVNKMQTYHASGYYIVSPFVVASALASCTPETKENRCILAPLSYDVFSGLAVGSMKDYHDSSICNSRVHVPCPVTCVWAFVVRDALRLVVCVCCTNYHTAS